ncbi:MAG: TIGR04282 family arsenosugar biosynthesis glycosyltransferase [Nitrospirota bacterium]
MSRSGKPSRDESRVTRHERENSPHPSPVTHHASRVTRADSALIIFAKAPIAGQVKTRLCPPLTPDEAASLHGSFVLDALERSKTAIAKHRLPLDRSLACAPSARHVFFKILEERHGVKLLDQVGEDLGARMTHACSTVFSSGYKQVLLVGTDVPSLLLDTYRDALTLLADHDLVLGPACDGGYYLIGLKRPAPELFADIPWSTDRVLDLTRQKADRLGFKTGLLPAQRDIDTIDDLLALIEEAGMGREVRGITPRPSPLATSLSPRTRDALELIAQRLRSRLPQSQGKAGTRSMGNPP